MKRITLILLAFQLCSYPVIAQWSEDPSVADTKVIVKNSQQDKPHIITDGSGGAIFFWIDDEGSGENIYYNKINSAGVTAWASTSTGVALTSSGALLVKFYAMIQEINTR